MTQEGLEQYETVNSLYTTFVLALTFPSPYRNSW